MIIDRTRIKEPNIKLLQMHRNTRIDEHSINFIKRIDNNLLHRYPIIGEFNEQYAQYLNVKSDNILLTSGVDGAIRSVFESIKKGATITLLEPTYAMYRVYSSAYEMNIISILPNKETFKIDLGDVLQAAKKSKIVFIPNPNAPIENVFNINQIEKLAQYADKYNFILFIDEAYFGFGAPTSIPLIKKYKNIIIARSFSKWFGLPSIRLGCLISNKNMIKQLHSYRLSYETNRLSIAVAEEALNNINYFKKYAQEINKSRSIVKQKMNNLKIKTHGELSNNILINSKLDLEQNSILVRQTIPYPAEEWMSVTLGSIKNITLFVDIFEQLHYNIRK